MTVRMLKDFRCRTTGYKTVHMVTGHYYKLPDGEAHILIARGFAVQHVKTPVVPKCYRSKLYGPTPLERFNNKIKKREDGCWHWIACKDKDGWGYFWDSANTDRCAAPYLGLQAYRQ